MTPTTGRAGGAVGRFLRRIRADFQPRNLRRTVRGYPVGFLRRGARWLGGMADWLESWIGPLAFEREDAAGRPRIGRNLALRGRHRNQRCFVIANGPSLAGHDISLLKDEITLAMNSFWRNPAVSLCQPTYYCFADWIFFLEEPHNDEFFRDLNSRITRSLFLVPEWIRGRNLRRRWLPDDRTYYLPIDDRITGRIHTPIDLAWPRPQPIINTALVPIIAALYMECDPIYLIGFDHDWLSHRGKMTHFHSGASLGNHPAVQQRMHLSDWPYRDLLDSALGLWEDYAKLRRMAETRGTRILNATRGGFLDVFKRISYEEALDGTPRTGARHG